MIGTIVAAHLDTERLEEGRLLVVAPPGTSCRRSLDLAHADTVLNMLDTRDAALASIMA